MAFDLAKYLKKMQEEGVEDQTEEFSSMPQSLSNAEKSASLASDESLVAARSAAQAARENKGIFKTGALRDGYQFGDISKNIFGSLTDLGLNAAEGLVRGFEGLSDTLIYGAGQVADWIGADKAATYFRNSAGLDMAGTMFSPVKELVDPISVIGQKGDAIPQMLGYIGYLAALGGAGNAVGSTIGGGLTPNALGAAAGGTTATTLGSGLSSMGHAMTEAYKTGANHNQAWTYGLLKGAVDAGSELVFGGLGKGINALGFGKGLTSADDMLAQKLSQKISNQFWKNMVQYGVKASAEGAEEILAGLGTVAAKKLSGMSKESWAKLLQDENLLEQFAYGVVVSGMMQSGMIPGTYGGSLAQANRLGIDFVQKEAGADTGNIWDNPTLNPEADVQMQESPETPVPNTGEATGAAQNPVDSPPEIQTAIDQFTRTGTVSNRMAETILGHSESLTKLRKQTGIEIIGTRSQQRNAVKEAVAVLSRQTAKNENTTAATGVAAVADVESMLGADEDIRGVETVDAPNLNQGGSENEEQQYEGTGVPSGDGGRLSGEGSGEQPGSVEQGAKQRGGTSEQRRRASERQRIVSSGSSETVSSRNLGIARGSTEKTLRLVPEALWDGELQEVAEKVRAYTGKDPVFVVGGILLEGPDGSLLARGVWTGKSVIIQADHMRVSASQIADHEIFHDKASRTPGMIKEIEDKISLRFNVQEMEQIVTVYMQRLRGTLDLPEGATPEQVQHASFAVLEEIWADAYAGVNRFGADAVQYAETVREVADGKLLHEGQQENGAAQATGPPENADKHLIGRTTDNRAFVVVDNDILDGIPKAEWVKTVRNNLKKKFPNGVYVGKNQIKINQQSRREMTFSKYMQTVYKNDPQVYEDKLRATDNADEILKASTDWVNEGLAHPRSDTVRGFARGNVLMRIGPNDYSAEVIVGTLSNGEMLLYDIVNLLPTKIVQKNQTQDYTANAPKELRSRTPASDANILTDVAAVVNSQTPDGNNVDLPDVNQKLSLDDIAEANQPSEEKVPQRLTPEDMKNVPEYRPDVFDGRRDTVPENVDISFARDWDKRAAMARTEFLRNVPKNAFEGTDALKKLGVKVENGVGLYRSVKQLIENDRSAKSVQKEARRAAQRLAATEEEKYIASGIASGAIPEADIPASVNREIVLELADYYWAEKAVASDMIRQQRAEINRGLFQKMESIMREVEDGNIKLPKAFTLNHRTPTRNMSMIFGDEIGQQLNAFLFDPVAVNEAERFRFVNRMHDSVRTFEDASGKKSKLTKAERAIAQQLIEGKAIQEMVAGMEMAESIKNAAHNLRNGADIMDVAREFSLSTDERKLVVKYTRWLQTKEIMESGQVDSVKVENAAKKYSELFDQFYDAINDFLVAHGYEPIGFIKGYTPHLQPEKNQTALHKAFQYLGIPADVSALPSSIAGLTKNYKPGKRWNPYFLQRSGDTTDYDIAKAFESYVDYMSDIFYHTDDIMRVRQAVNYFRQTYAPENIREHITWASELRYASVEEKANFLRDQNEISRLSFLSEEDIHKAMDEYVDKQYSNIGNTTLYSDLVVWMEDYANKLAGKQLLGDRDMERSVGRVSLNLGNKLVRCFARAQVAVNISSALNQMSQVSQILAENGAGNTAAAFKDIVAGNCKKGDWNLDSDFLTEKKGIHYLVNTAGDMITGAMFKPLELMDGLVSTLAVRGRYLKEIKAGKTPDAAMRAADQFGRNVMGSRAKGSIPLAFQQRNLLSQMLHIFQLEAANNWDHLRVDLPKDFRQIEAQHGKSVAVRALAGVIIKMLLSAFFINRLAEEIYGGTPAPFDLLGLSANFIASGKSLSTNEWIRTMIDNGWESLTGERLFDTEEMTDGFNWSNSTEDALYIIGNDIPYLRNAMALMGWGDETLPMIDIPNAISGISDAVSNGGVFSYEMAQQLLSILGDVLPGGRQLEKTVQGLETYLRGGKYKGIGESARLQYPVDKNWWKAIRAPLFGDAAMNERNEFYAAGVPGLSANQTAVYDSLVKNGADEKEVYAVIQEYREITGDDALNSYERGKLGRDVIRNADLTDVQKLELYSGLVRADSRCEKFRKMLEAGMDWSTIMDVYDAYCVIDSNEMLSAGEKATEFAKWIDDLGLSDQEKVLTKDLFKYWNMFPARAQDYNDFVEAGLSTDDAYELTNALSDLKPEAGETEVQDVQRWRTCVDFSSNEDIQMAALAGEMLPEQFAKVNLAFSFGVSPDAYVTYYEIRERFDANGDGRYTQAEITKAIASMNMLSPMKAVLWQIVTGSSSARNNPFNTSMGQKVLDVL